MLYAGCPGAPSNPPAERCAGVRCTGPALCNATTGLCEAQVVDAGRVDAGAPDAGFDAGTRDDAGIDAGAIDAGPVDAGVADAGIPDAGEPVDAGRVGDREGVRVDEGAGEPGASRRHRLLQLHHRLAVGITFHGRVGEQAAASSRDQQTTGDDKTILHGVPPF